MKTQIKCLVKKNGKILVETEDRELAQYLSKKILEARREGVEVEWVYSYETPLGKSLTGKQWTTWVFGCCVKELGYIEIYLDNIFKAYGINGFEPVETWFSHECSKHLVHELIHYHQPEWTETQTERAAERLMEACEDLLKATRLTVHIGDKSFSYLLTEDNRVLRVKNQ